MNTKSREGRLGVEMQSEYNALDFHDYSVSTDQYKS